MIATALDLGVVVGDWHNTNDQGGIARIVVEDNGDGRVRVNVNDWGTVVAPVFAFEFDSDSAGAVNALFDLGFEEVRMQVNVKQGVLVVATFNAFKDDSGRSNYFHREFFYRR